MARLGIISAYPDEDWHAQRIVEAARARGVAEVLSPLDFGADTLGGGRGRSSRSSSRQPRLLVRGEPAESYDAFLTPRALGDEGEHELQLELYRTLAEEGALVVNDVRALSVAIDKWKTSWLLARSGVPTPRAIVTQRLEAAVEALEALGGKAVLKPLYGSLGIGIELVDARAAGDEGVRQQLARALERHKALYLQAWVDTRDAEGFARDTRAFVVGGHVEAAIARLSRAGEFRTNVHLGGRVEEVRLDRTAAELAVRAAELLGLDYAGVDLVATRAGPVVLEVNGTPLFRGIWEATGRDMGVAIVQRALARLGRSGRIKAL